MSGLSRLSWFILLRHRARRAFLACTGWMADDWQPGDLALCVEIFGNDHGYGVSPDIRLGAVYTVAKVIRAVDMYGRAETGLVLPDARTAHPKALAHNAGQFRKIRPHTPDAEDIETIRLLNGKPVPVEA